VGGRLGDEVCDDDSRRCDEWWREEFVKEICWWWWIIRAVMCNNEVEMCNGLVRQGGVVCMTWGVSYRLRLGMGSLCRAVVDS
jgi:hypothetical protein